MQPKRILALTTGGTIEKSYCESDGTISNRESILHANLVQRLRLPHTQLEVCEIMAKDSLQMTDSDRQAISQKINEQSTGYDGIIVLHGTDTMEHTLRYCYKQTAEPPIPVVFTGAMKPAGFEDSDARQNVTEALLAAQILPPGLYISFHSQIFPAPNVRKNKKRLTFEPTGD
ncbi:asparaginase domain-containing protein [Pelagicoccus mobilis]|uniref:Asparaginase n=1 Tax=Pelagicoccus mobilis TaxID=415221 RepID=A0A934S2K8_9BACT|nr:asparaginase domain-containing protein [Pelagicoccus mobilis]MBK1878274.1 asparaginase [Pelagicoccus mobilis]